MSEHLIVVCPHCHRPNRVQQSRLNTGDGGHCGQCKAALFTGAPLTLNSHTIDAHIGRTEIPLVIDFWAPWCGPCRMMAPAFEQAAARLGPTVQLAKLNTEDEPALATRFSIRSIPTLVMFRAGHEIARQSGASDVPGLTRWVRENQSR